MNLLTTKNSIYSNITPDITDQKFYLYFYSFYIAGNPNGKLKF